MPIDTRERDLGLVGTAPLFVSTDTTLTPDQVKVQVTPPGSGTTTITLPPVAECEGREFSITSNGNDTGTIEVVGGGDELDAYAPSALTADQDRLLCKSDGRNWNTLSTVAT